MKSCADTCHIYTKSYRARERRVERKVGGAGACVVWFACGEGG